MDIKKLEKKLIELSQCDSHKNAKDLLKELGPEKHFDGPPYYTRGCIDSPFRELWEKGFNENSVIVASNGTDGSGPFIGYRYYLDIIEAFNCEVQMTLMGAYHMWLEPDCKDLSSEIYPMIKEQSFKLVELLRNLNSPGNKSDYSQLVELLEDFEERTFSIFETIRDHIINWNNQPPTYLPYDPPYPSNLPLEFSIEFNKPLEEIDMTNPPEFFWVAFKLPPSDRGV